MDSLEGESAPLVSSTRRVRSKLLSTLLTGQTEEESGTEMTSFSPERNPGEYTQLLDEKKPDNRFFKAVALALVDQLSDSPAYRASFTALFEDNADVLPHFSNLNPEQRERENDADVQLRITRAKHELRKALSKTLREMCATYAKDLNERFSPDNAARTALASPVYSDFYKRKVDEHFQRPENAAISRGTIGKDEDSELLYFKDTPLSAEELLSNAQHFLTLAENNPLRAELGNIIFQVFQGNTLARTTAFNRLVKQHNEAEEKHEDTDTFKTEMKKYCRTNEAIESFFFDHNRLSPIYFSKAFNTFFEAHSYPRGDRNDLIVYLMGQTEEKRALRKKLGEEILTIFSTNPQFSTEKFKTLYDSPVRDLEQVKRYCESEEAIRWYVTCEDYRKVLHFKMASLLGHSSKSTFLTQLSAPEIVSAREDYNANAQITGDIIAALRLCQNGQPVERPEAYETICKAHNSPLTASLKNQGTDTDAEIEEFAKTAEAFRWYIRTYLAHPEVRIPASCLQLILESVPCTIRTWGPSPENPRELILRSEADSSEEAHEGNPRPLLIDILANDSSPPTFVVLNRFNFSPLGSYERFCETYGVRAAQTVNWIRKSLGEEKHEKYLETLATHAGCPEIDGVIICETLARRGIPFSLLVTQPKKDSYTFVTAEGCISNLSDVEQYTDASTAIIEQAKSRDKKKGGHDFAAVLRSRNTTVFEDGEDFTVIVKSEEIDPAIQERMKAQQKEEVTLSLTVDTRTPDGKKGTKIIPSDTFLLREIQVPGGNAQPQSEIHFQRVHKGNVSLDKKEFSQPFVQTPIREKTKEEIERGKFDLAWETNGGAIKNSVTKEGFRRKTGEPIIIELDEEPVAYSDLPEEKTAAHFDRPPPPSFSPTPPQEKPVKLKDAIKAGFTHNPLPDAEKQPAQILTPKDTEKLAALKKAVPSYVELGKSTAADSFFDTVAQFLNALENTEKYDAKVVRLFIELRTEQFNFGPVALMICEAFNISIHVVEIDQDNQTTQTRYAKGENPVPISRNQINWDDPRTLHVASITRHQAILPENNSDDDEPEQELRLEQRFAPLTKKPVKDNSFFKAVADSLNNGIYGISSVSTGREIYTEENLRGICAGHLTELPAKNWVKAQLNTDPDNTDYIETPTKKDNKGKGEENDEQPVSSGERLKTPYTIYCSEVGTPASEKAKTFTPKVDLEARLLCQALNNGTRIQILEVQEEDIKDDKGEFSVHKMVKKRWLYTQEGRREIDENDVNWDNGKTVTLVHDRDTGHIESINSYLPRTDTFKVINGTVHLVLGLNLLVAMVGQGGAAFVQMIKFGWSAPAAIIVGYGAIVGKWALLLFYSANKFGGLPSTFNKLAHGLYNSPEHLANFGYAIKTGNWSWKEDALPVVGTLTIAAIPAIFFGALNGPTLDGFANTVQNNRGLFTNYPWLFPLADAAKTELAYRLFFISSGLANLVSTSPILENIKYQFDKILKDGKNIWPRGDYERTRYMFGIIGGIFATGAIGLGFSNFWGLSINTLFPGTAFGYVLALGIMPYMIGLGFGAAMPLGRKFFEYLFDVLWGDIEYQHGDFRKDNPDYQGFRSWFAEQSKAHKAMFVAAYLLAFFTVIPGGLPNVFQAELDHQTKFFAIFALIASVITELEGTNMVFSAILNTIKRSLEYLGVKASDFLEWLKESREDLPFSNELKIRMVNFLEKHFPCCKPRLSNWAYTQRYGLFEEVGADQQAAAGAEDRVFLLQNTPPNSPRL